MLDNNRPRRVVPRWRDSRVVATTPEAVTPPPKSVPDHSAVLALAKDEFRTTQNVPIAAELLFLSIDGRDDKAAEASANFIKQRCGSTELTRLGRVSDEVIRGEVRAIQEPSPKEAVRIARGLLRVDYENPVLLIDMARHLVNLGHPESALRYVRAAVNLAPNSRFVLRASARYFLHIGDPERAHHVLTSSDLSRVDPWVQASEIAVATVRGRTSLQVKKVLRNLDPQKRISLSQSELASAAATVELLSGAEKNAKKLFKKVIERPTDNSIAQAEWAAQRLGLVVDQHALSTPLSFEANSSHAYRNLAIPTAIEYAIAWQGDEPYSSRAQDALAFLYALQEDYESALSAAQLGLEANVDSLPHRLNVMFMKSQLGQIDGLMDELMLLSKHLDAKTYAAHLLANAGALAFVVGDFTQGRVYYDMAVQAARRQGKSSDEALALAYLARAEAFAGVLEPSRLNVLSKQIERLPSPGALYIMQALTTGEASASLARVASRRVAKRVWEWDSVTNTLVILK